MNDQQKSLNSLKEFYCDICDYNTVRKCDYIKHCTTRKHLKKCDFNNCQQKSRNPPIELYICNICNKQYKERSGLWRHKQNPCYTNVYLDSNVNDKLADIEEINKILQSTPEVYDSSGNNFPVSNDLIIEFIKQNQELKNILLEEREESRNRYNEQTAKIEELAKQNVIVNNTTNNNNNFNLNIFLNEKCKDAISMIEFIESLQVGTSDVEYTGKYGYVEGITKIFIDGLKQLDIYKRPIHCTDLKRETLYIKEEKTWEKDNQEKSKLKKAINAVVRKNMKQITHWQDENPKCNILDSNEYFLHLSIMRQSLGGGTQEKTERNNDKIIKMIAKQVIIDRNHL